MWTIGDVGKRAWNGLKNYGLFAAICVILVSLLGILSVIPYVLGAFLLAVCICLAPISPFLSCIVNGAYTDILGVGMINFFIRSTKQGRPVPLSTIFSGFKTGHYSDSAKILIFRNIFQFLWTLLFFVPGVIKWYEYRMIPYLIADYPEKGQDEVFRLSKQMMMGNKLKAFGCDLLFGLICSIVMIPFGLLYALLPNEVVAVLAVVLMALVSLAFSVYYNAFYAELYLVLNGNQPVVSGGSSHVVYQPENQALLQDVMGNDDDARTVDINSDAFHSTPAYGRPVLVGIQGEYAGASIPLEPGQKLVVGRDSSKCNVVLSSLQVSRLHMTVEFVNGKFIVVDYSSYGTFDLEQGRLPKEKSVNVAPGTSLRLGNGDDVFKLELR